MKILHLYSDWKWTGPAEPVLQACRSLQDRGHTVVCAFRAPQLDMDETIEMKAEGMGVHFTTRFALDRYMGPANTVRDLIAIPRFIRDQQFDVVHTNLSHDHALGGICVRRLGKNRPLLVRTLHKRSVLSDSMPNRILLRQLTDASLTFTPRFRQRYIDRFALDPDSVGVQPMTVNLERFTPNVTVKNMRTELGIDADAPLIGIVGRWQKYRRADVFLDAAAQLLKSVPNARFLVIGRSSQIQETVVKPMMELGIDHCVTMTGYRIDDYVDIMASLDIFSLLMPGFDGTARAVREAMALGVPCVVSDIGMLPEIIDHEKTGLVSPLDATQLAQAWQRLIQNPEERKVMGQVAALHATHVFDIAEVGPRLESFYSEQLARLKQG